jgi:hypothetical protein
VTGTHLARKPEAGYPIPDFAKEPGNGYPASGFFYGGYTQTYGFGNLTNRNGSGSLEIVPTPADPATTAKTNGSGKPTSK